MSDDPPRIWATVPFCHTWEGNPPGLDLALAYRNYAAGCGSPNDWLIFMDGDAMPCTRRWFQLIEAAVMQHHNSDVGAFTAMTNRLIKRVSGWQMAPEADIDDNDMAHHWRIGNGRLKQFWIETRDVTLIDESHQRTEREYKPMSGFFMLIRKQAWISSGGLIGRNGFYHNDHDIHRALRAAGWRILLLHGLYFYHWNRWDRRLSARNERGDV